MKAKTHICVCGLRVSYGEHEVLHGVDFTVNRGEFLAIVGKSGCGKSTLLHALAGFIPRQGEIDIPADVGMVFQSYAVFPWLTVRENIAFGLHHINSDKREEVIHQHLDMTGLSSEADKYPGALSGGQAQRAALARALAPNPEVVFMDEPFGALDAYTREKMQTWLLDVWEKHHKTVLFVTHNIEEAIFLSDRVLLLGQGNVLDEFRVPFSRPRTDQIKFTAGFTELKKQILDRMEHL